MMQDSRRVAYYFRHHQAIQSVRLDHLFLMLALMLRYLELVAL
jgi:hypothetical protein